MPLGPVLHTQGGQVRYKKNPLKGFPDIAGILKRKKGQFFACEFKAASGRTTPEQTEWHERLRESGAVVFVVKSLEEFIEKMGEIDVDEKLEARKGERTAADVGA